MKKVLVIGFILVALLGVLTACNDSVNIEEFEVVAFEGPLTSAHYLRQELIMAVQCLIVAIGQTSFKRCDSEWHYR